MKRARDSQTAVSNDRLVQRMHALLADVACDVFLEPSEQQRNEDLVVERLNGPLKWLLCGGNPETVFEGMQQASVQSNFCGKVFKSGEPAIFCKDCQTDPTCCLCMDCFENSEHKNHNYRLFASGGGGCCDCGDPEAWSYCVYCDIHKPREGGGGGGGGGGKEGEGGVEEAEVVIPPELKERAAIFFSALLWYCMDVLSCGEGREDLPLWLLQGQTAQCVKEDTFLTLLYNDEDHSYGDVISALVHSIKVAHPEAVSIASMVDRKGRAVIKVGDEKQCLAARDALSKTSGRSRATPLNTKTFHSAVVAHQTCAVACTALLQELAGVSSAFRRLISAAMVTNHPQRNICFLDDFFVKDNSKWITARVCLHRLVMSSIFMDPMHKKDLAISLARNYQQLQVNFVQDSHHHDVCASNITVQLFTVPSLSRMLVVECDVLETILSTILHLLQDFIRDGILKLTSRYKHNRMVFTFYDLRYVLRNAPEVMTEEFEKRAMAAFSLLLDLLSLLENADLAKRQRGFHVEQEEPWEKTFNLCILLLPAVQFFVKWCSSSKNLLCKAVEATLNKFHELLNDRYSVTFTKHNVDKSLVGKDSLQLIPFDVFKDHVSVHHPIPRLLAGLILGASSYDLSINSLLQIQPDDTKTPLLLMEFSSRVIVMAVQVMAGMWKRNGYSVVNQVINYQFHYSRDTMYDKDIVLLQAMASILDPNVFLYALIYKFRLDRWLMFPDSDPDNRGEPADDALRFFISEAEEFLFLLITIFGERYTEGVGEGVTLCDSLRREIIHRLFISPLSHSEILKQFRLGDSEMEVEKLVKEVATQNRSAPGGKYMFELNPEFEKEYNPFFYHYNKTDHSKAENVYRKKAKQAGASAAMKSRQPPKPPPFCKQFQGVTRLCSCPVLHRLLYCIFQKAASPSSFWSDRLLHEALHLCTLILSDEDPADQHSLRYAATGRHGNSAFLGYLEQLQSNRRSEEHKPLLSWIIEFLVKVRDQSASSSSVGASTDHTPPQGGGTGGAPMESSVDRPGDQSSDKLKKRKAEQQRSKLMAQMSAMQKRFLEKHKQEMNDIEEDVDYHKGESTAMEVEAGSVTVTRCAVGVASVQAPPPAPLPVTCILCQEKTNDFASHESLYVQAVQVQRSSVLRPKCVSVPPGEEREHQILCARADMWSGVYTMGCGHYMHAECWKRFHVNKRQETNYHFLMPIAGVSALWHKGEFLCPLCQSFGSNVLPLLPSLHHVQPPSSPPHGQDPSSQTRSTSSSSSPSSAVVTETSSTAPLAHAPSREIALAEWVELLALAVKMAEAEDEDSMEANPPTFLDKLKEFFPDYQKPSCHFAAGGKSLKDEMTTIFSQAIYMHTFNGIPNEASSSVSLSLWKNISYTISVLEFNARTRGKFVIEMLSTRELDILKSLVRCGYETSVQPKTSELGRFCQELSNTFLLQCPAFSELASILEVDAFGMLVNLHYAATLLFANLSVPTGTLGQNSTLTSLVGVTNQILVRVATALRVLQFLLTTQPMSMDTEVTENSSPEVSVGLELQKLWSKFRSKAKMPTENPPPPYDLYVGLREFLYPFLHCSVLFLHTVTGISLVHSSSSEASTFEDICVYLDLPLAVHTLLEPSLSSQFDICRLANNWCTHPRLATQLEGALPLPILSAPRKLITLPKVFSDMVKMVSNFKCPNRAADGDDTQAAMLCLVCGKLLCTNSYCCQREVTTGAGEDTKMVGGLIQHALSCGAGYGMAMWVVENYIVLLDATDLGHVKGCTLDPPYLDRYGEPDPGLRRGSPLWLQEDRYLDLQHMWFGHLIPQTISKEMEKNRHLVGISWANM